MVEAFSHDVLVLLLLLVIFSWSEFDVVRYPWSNRMDIVVFLSLRVGELVPMYVLVLLGPSLTECMNYSLRHIISLLFMLAWWCYIFMWNQLKHQSIKCYAWFVGFSCSSLMCLWVSVWSCFHCVSFRFVGFSAASSIDFGLKLNTQKKGVMDILKYWVYL